MAILDDDNVVFRFDFDRALEALVYLAAKSDRGLTKYEACKLLFLADKYHLVRHGRPITGDCYYALPDGPAPTRTLDLLNEVLADESQSSNARVLESTLKLDRTFRYPRFSASKALERDALSKSDLEALDATWERFGAENFWVLKALTHETPAYQRAWDQRAGQKSVPMAFEDFFEEDPDALDGVFEEMIDNFELRRAFPTP